MQKIMAIFALLCTTNIATAQGIEIPNSELESHASICAPFKDIANLLKSENVDQKILFTGNGNVVSLSFAPNVE